jgi:outer membrane protein
MKLLYKTILAVIVLLFFHYAAFGAEPYKIGVIDLQRCMAESREGQRVLQILKDKRDALQRQYEEKKKELVKIQEDWLKQRMMLSMDAQVDKRKSFERKSLDLRYFMEDANDELEREKADKQKGILADLEKIVTEIGKQGNYHLILERRGGGVLYLSGVVDLTDDVIKAYDKTKP